MGAYPVTLDLPPTYFALIGQINTHYAFLEWRIKSLVCKVLGVGPKQGRLSIRDQRIDEQLGLLEKLLELADLKVDFAFSDLNKPLKDIDDCRNALIHGVWVKHPAVSYPVLQVTKGAWKRPPMERGSRKIMPAGIPITPPDLMAEMAGVDAVLQKIESLSGLIDAALQASQKKCCEPPEAPPPPQDRTLEAR